MNNVFAKIEKEIYPLYEDFNLEIKEDLCFELGKTYYLNGDNGVGKSSFLKHIFLKKLNEHSKGKFQYLFLSQDIISQFYLAKAYFSNYNNKKIADIETMLKTLVELHISKPIYSNNHLILVFDEIDKFGNLNELIDFKNKEISLVFVSHTNKTDISKIDYTLNFTKIDQNNVRAEFI